MKYFPSLHVREVGLILSDISPRLQEISQVIWIRLGNCSVSEIELLLRNQKQQEKINTLFDVIFQAQDFRLHGMAFRTFFNHPIACFQD